MAGLAEAAVVAAAKTGQVELAEITAYCKKMVQNW